MNNAFPPKCFYCGGDGVYTTDSEDGNTEYTKDCHQCNKTGVDVNKVSRVQQSCIFTALASGKKLPNKAYTMPDEAYRLLCARLMLEEAQETINALGFMIVLDEDGKAAVYERSVQDMDPLSMEKIIDGCVDTDYVAAYCLTLMGVPDIPHMLEVCAANDAKFPGGVATPHPTIPGKYGKPPGWKPPDHRQYFPKGQR